MNNRIDELVQQFERLKQQVTAANIKQEQWFNKSDLFNSSSFYCQSDETHDYLKELETNIEKLSKIGENEYLEFLVDRITQQFSCFRSLLNSQSVNNKAKSYHRSHNQRLAKVKQLTRTVHQSSQDLYAELSKLQEFERRLIEMVTEKQQQLQQYSGSKLKNDYQQQVLVTQQRLGRCRQALSKVEEQIQKLDEQSKN
ncbi:MAG: primosomal replication protein [Gammaproteobacteria bacterium]|nr:primosomal replication protein [Gammaproteobacteria bacterium]